MNNEIELIKPIVRVGNSAGVILPREWLHGKAKVVLLEERLEPEQEIFGILRSYLSDIMALALVGSYATGEQGAESDVDALAITHSTNKRIKHGKYEIILISEDRLGKYLEGNIFPLLPMLIEAKSLINGELINKYKNFKLTRRNLSFHFETTKSIMNVVKADIELDKEMGESCAGDADAYSLILRLRGIYIVNCLLKGKIWSKREFLQLVKKVAGSLKVYDGYVRIKNDKAKRIHSLPIEEAEKLHSYIVAGIKKQEKEWAETSN